MKTCLILTLLFWGTACGTPPSDAAATYDAHASGPRPGVSRWDGRFGKNSDGLDGFVERDILRR